MGILSMISPKYQGNWQQNWHRSQLGRSEKGSPWVIKQMVSYHWHHYWPMVHGHMEVLSTMSSVTWALGSPIIPFLPGPLLSQLPRITDRFQRLCGVCRSQGEAKSSRESYWALNKSRGLYLPLPYLESSTWKVKQGTLLQWLQKAGDSIFEDPNSSPAP